VAALAWAYLAYLAWDMQQRMSAGAMGMGMDAAMSQFRPWGSVGFVTTFIMWAVMMVAMMVPTAALMILAFATVNQRRLERQQPFVPTGVFLSGYLVVWLGFSIATTMMQWGLHQAALLTPTWRAQLLSWAGQSCWRLAFISGLP
jgi:predicted metal-binding membrane protein